MTIDEAIIATRRRWLAEPIAWGIGDCAMSCDEYAFLLTGKHPGAAWKGKYSTELGAARLIARHGSLAGLFRSGMPVCADPVTEIRRGDIVICGENQNQIAGIHLGHHTMFRGEGARMLILPIIDAWRCRGTD